MTVPAPDITPQEAVARQATGQALEAAERLHLDAAKQPRLPWDSLVDVVGPLWPGEFWVMAAASGNGKTTTLMNAVHAWAMEKRRVYMLPLEQSAAVMRNYWAAFACDVPPQLVLENRLSPADRQSIRAHLQWQQDRVGGRYVVGFSDIDVLTPETIVQAFDEAIRFGAEILVIDHLNHMAPGRTSRGSRYDALTEICQRIIGLGRDAAVTGLATIAAAQIGRDKDGDLLAPFLPPRESSIQGGEVIRQTCHVALGWYRPLIGTYTHEDGRSIRLGQRSLKDFLEPDTIAVRVLKHRLRGQALGEIVKLGFQRGRIRCSATEDRLAYESRHDL